MDWFDKLFISEAKSALEAGSGGLSLSKKMMESIEWDGKFEGHLSVEYGNMHLVHVSDYAVKDLEEALGISVEAAYNNSDENFPWNPADYYETKELGDGGFMIIGGFAISAPTDKYWNEQIYYGDFVLPKKGIYFMHTNSDYDKFHTSKITFASPIIIENKIEAQHISIESVADALKDLKYEYGEDVTIEWDHKTVYPYIDVDISTWFRDQLSASSYYTYLLRKVSDLTLVDKAEGNSIETIGYMRSTGINNYVKPEEYDELHVVESDGFVIVCHGRRPLIVSCPHNNETCSHFGSIVFPESGLYLLTDYYTKNVGHEPSWSYVSKFTIPNKRYKIDSDPVGVSSWNELLDKPFSNEEVAPIRFNTLGDLTDQVVVNDDINGYQYVYASDFYIPYESRSMLDVCITKTVDPSNFTSNKSLTSYTQLGDKDWRWSSYVVFISEDNCEVPNGSDGEILVFPKRGVYFRKTDSEAVVGIKFKAGTTIRKTIDREYLPDYSTTEEITAMVESKIENAMIIPSSTEGSTKKFKISIDDTGAITATEVV